MAAYGVRGNSRGATLHLLEAFSFAGHEIAAFESPLRQRGRHVFPGWLVYMCLSLGYAPRF